MKYDEWVSSVPIQMQEDAVWRVEAYRLALFAADIGWHDISKLMRDRRTLDLSSQLYRAIGSISANIAEGFSRNSGKEKARFYEYALGSARESRDWFYKGRHILGVDVIAHRIELLTRIIRLLLTMIPDQRERALKESTVEYEVIPDIVKNVPMPNIEDPNRRTSADPTTHTSLITYHSSETRLQKETTTMTDLYPLAFSTLGCPGWMLDHAAEQAAKAGYRALEIRVLDGEIIPSTMPAGRRRQIKETMKRHNMGIIALGLSVRFSSPNSAERQGQVEELRKYLELANELEAPMVRVFGGNVQEGHTVAETINWVAESLARAMPLAEAQGVTVLLETHDAFCRGAEVAQVLQQVVDPRLKAVWDVHHPFRMGESIEETWRLIGARTAHIHIKDARRKPDGSWQLVLLGQGEVPCQAVVKLLHRVGYQGYITAEWEKKWHPEIEEPEVALPQHAEVLRGWFKEIQG